VVEAAVSRRGLLRGGAAAAAVVVGSGTASTLAGGIDGSGRPPSNGLFDGTGQWLPLVVGGESAIDGMSVEEVLVLTRLAADRAGATKMDRPFHRRPEAARFAHEEPRGREGPASPSAAPAPSHLVTGWRGGEVGSRFAGVQACGQR
jgi:secreted PhoX family phosphatase